MSLSQSNPQPLVGSSTPKQQRRMTSPASKASLKAPDVPKPQGRPPSPLRNEFIPDTFTGIDPDESFSDDEDDNLDDQAKWKERSPSPSSSVSQLAASITQRVGTFLGTMTPRSPGVMPTDAELEAEAERERERSRREAERILTREAEERKLVEERVLEMMSNARSLPPPPSRTESMTPSPSGSQKSNWWSAAKNKLTPTKDKDLPTPAQQVILEAKARDKDKDKKNKGKEKEKDNERNELATKEAAQNLDLPPPPPRRKPVPPSPSSPTPSRPSLSNMAPNLTPSSMRSVDPVSFSPTRESPPLYAQFNAQGTLDMPGTLLTIAKRFEKLEKWTVGHVRALEDRMSDVERWLVDKEKEKEQAEVDKASTHAPSSAPSEITDEIQDLKDGLAELQSRVGILGREMAKFVTSPPHLSSGPSRQPAPMSLTPQTTSTHIVQDRPASPSSPPPLVSMPVAATTPLHRRLSSTARESTSPPMASLKTPGTRLPYPTGDYATPPDSTTPLQGPFASPPHSPPVSLASSTRILPLSLPGLGQGLGILQTDSNSSLRSSARATSPQQQQVPESPKANIATAPTATATPTTPVQSQAQAQAQAHGLPAPRRPLPRPASVSPTPRKRYTVALGEPIVSPPDSQGRPSPRPAIPTSPTPHDRRDEEGEEYNTIAKLTLAKFAKSMNGDYKSSPTSASISTPGPTPGLAPTSSSSSPSPATKRRLRAQSAYGFASVQALQAPITPLRPKMRSRSTERLTPGPEQSFPTGKFVDPLVLRRQEREKEKERGREGISGLGLGAGVKSGKKLPVGQLVAFFDGEKKGR
ncbi:hypothetical protein C0989_012616 [Termitomyces sp. Mn162]|nr:hypothetical protein C0989_012616 [Termitomyces sp. Mn162]KAH0578721.1 hypothetical protein H2248_003848 [Termitomyces sp. 'cryptogamus']